MNELENARKEIDIIDAEMARLFARRMEWVKKIAGYKAKNCVNITDSAREKEILISRVNEYTDNNTSKFYRESLLSTIAISKKYQRFLNSASDDIFVSAGKNGYNVTVKRGVLNELAEYIKKSEKTVIVTDDGVPRQHVMACAAALGGYGVLVLPQGEENKNLDNYSKVISYLHDNGFSRTDTVIAVGGGVVGDTAGFAAATYNRGIRFYNVPTTLLAQVDSSIGGKVGVDHLSGKNLIGAFYDPEAVIIDPDVLKTLDRRQINNGMAEIIKIALICDAGLFDMLETAARYEHIEEVIRRAVALKAEIVERDREESDLRKVLNFGHTIGHAIESAEGLGSLLHGECVALGMIPMCSERVRERLICLLRANGLPVSYDGAADKLKEFIKVDKKKSGRSITVVTVEEIGKYKLSEKDAEEFLDSLDDLMGTLRR